MKKRKGAVRQLVFWLGEGARQARLFYLRMNGIQIGRNVFISFGAKIDTQFGRVQIGDDVHITYGSCILAHDGAIKHTWVAPGANPAGQVVIGRGAFIGVNSVILKDVTIGECCVVGAGSVVTKSTPAYSLVCGNPARVIRTLAGDASATDDPGGENSTSANGRGR